MVSVEAPWAIRVSGPTTEMAPVAACSRASAVTTAAILRYSSISFLSSPGVVMAEMSFACRE